MPLNLFNELNRVGWHLDDFKVTEIFDTNPTDSSFFVHLNCYLWSYGIEFPNNSTNNNFNSVNLNLNNPLNLDKLVFESLIKVRLAFFF